MLGQHLPIGIYTTGPGEKSCHCAADGFATRRIDMVSTTRLSGLGRDGDRNGFEAELRRLSVTQNNSRPGHPTSRTKSNGSSKR